MYQDETLLFVMDGTTGSAKRMRMLGEGTLGKGDTGHVTLRCTYPLAHAASWTAAAPGKEKFESVMAICAVHPRDGKRCLPMRGDPQTATYRCV
jgi:hypothetical protein